MRAFGYEVLVFGLKQARSCVFAGTFLALLLVTKYAYDPSSAMYVGALSALPRNDLLFIAAVAIQALLVATKIETWDEVKVISLFHLLGLALEIFKTSPGIGSWTYPGPGVLKVLTVPLYTGFMYAAIGSYMAQAWRVLKLRMERFPRHLFSVPLCAAIYANFFTHHFIWDVRYVLIALVFIVFARTWVHFTVLPGKERRMPLTLSFALIGFFIWVAENIGTFVGAWKYPDQAAQWRVVGFGKITAWSLLIILSLIIVANLKHLKEYKVKRQTAAHAAVERAAS